MKATEANLPGSFKKIAAVPDTDIPAVVFAIERSRTSGTWTEASTTARCLPDEARGSACVMVPVKRSFERQVGDGAGA